MSDIRAVGYCRVSTEEQGDSRAGLEAQESVIRAEIARRGWELTNLHIEVASGKSLAKRPELAAALKSLRTHEADILIMAKQDRLSRSVLDFASLMATAQAEGWRILMLDFDVDMSTAAGEFVANMMSAMSQWERRVIGERTKAGLQAVRARGITLGRPSKVTPETLRMIRTLRGTGLSWQKVADALTREGVPTAQGGVWHGATVRKLAEKES